MGCIMEKSIFIIFIIIFAVIVPQTHASCLIYYKPELKGKVIETETKAPIEGRVVSVYYEVEYYNISGGGSRSINTRETLTDENGEFVIPSYMTLISPFNTSDMLGMIIYKPGYGSFPNNTGMCVGDQEYYFSSEMQGIQSECIVDKIPYKFTYGVIEMPKLKTRQQRLSAMPSSPMLTGIKEFPLLFKLINEENRRLGLREVN